LQVLELGLEIAEGRGRPILVLMQDIGRVDHGARTFFASEEYLRLACGTALVVGSPVGRAIGHFFVGLNRLNTRAKSWTMWSSRKPGYETSPHDSLNDRSSIIDHRAGGALAPASGPNAGVVLYAPLVGHQRPRRIGKDNKVAELVVVCGSDVDVRQEIVVVVAGA
jgi:hypothetical protein